MFIEKVSCSLLKNLQMIKGLQKCSLKAQIMLLGLNICIASGKIPSQGLCKEIIKEAKQGFNYILSRWNQAHKQLVCEWKKDTFQISVSLVDIAVACSKKQQFEESPFSPRKT